MQKLTKKQILRLPEEISRVLQHRFSKSTHFGFYQIENHSDVSRLGLAIPKRQAKRAIDRNRMKRVIREAFRKSNHLINHDIVVKLQTPIGKQTKRRLRDQERRKIAQQINHFFQEM
jgi:ribonuclease P protein component